MKDVELRNVSPNSWANSCYSALCVGFRWDRQWLIVNSKGRAYTQRVEPKLALVEVELPKEAFFDGWEPTNDSYLGMGFFLWNSTL